MERKYNYKYIINEDKRVVVALSTFAGKVVRGVSRCSPNDKWDVEVGKQLATARCSAKIAHMRLKRAECMVGWSTECLDYYTKVVAEYKTYEKDAIEGVKRATAELAKLEEQFC